MAKSTDKKPQEVILTQLEPTPEEDPRPFINRLNYAPGIDNSPEVNNQPSQTIPDQAMPLQEMLNKFVIPATWPQVFDEQYDTPQSAGLPDISKMDKIEIAQLNQEAQAQIEKSQAALQMLQEEEFQRIQEENRLLNTQNSTPQQQGDEQ